MSIMWLMTEYRMHKQQSLLVGQASFKELSWQAGCCHFKYILFSSFYTWKKPCTSLIHCHFVNFMSLKESWVTFTFYFILNEFSHDIPEINEYERLWMLRFVIMQCCSMIKEKFAGSWRKFENSFTYLIGACKTVTTHDVTTNKSFIVSHRVTQVVIWPQLCFSDSL
jgi:hypothetical protein